ncbi:ABC transporter permease [Egibacter rhizosphaerae]|uniref:ABC transporter permease n=2 Tax=Egibacter rhizosphaerae TaxID=1670831 RepID=A0A411YLT1_9ACTN|nr:ABC transporter permease [Egibacter rhizosphaerae]
MRIALTVPMLLILLTIVFLLLRVAPGDPIAATMGDRISAEELESRRAAAGLDEPLLVQYGTYLFNALTGDFGDPVTDRRTTTGVVADTFPATLELTAFAMLVALVLGIGVGALSGRLRDTPFDVGGRLFGIIVYAAPIFWVGLLGQLFFSVRLGWFPTGGRATGFDAPNHVTGFYVLDSILTLDPSALWSSIHHLILPGTTLGLVFAGIFMRFVRVNMLQTLRADYVESARARGVGERPVVFHHALKNALVPVVTVVGLQFALLLGGSILTERVFSWPGLGLALIDFLGARDYVGVQGIVTFLALVVVIVSLLIDIASALIDPRIRH